MKIFPAIDIKGGKAVRLFQGDYDQVTVYSENPVDVARDFQGRGAKNLHLVDLDGARDGALVNFKTIETIIKEVGLFVEVGGGIRDENRIVQYLDIGVGRVILGTVAIQKPTFLQEMVIKYGDRIAVSVDVKDGYVAINGWKEQTDIEGMAFCAKLRAIGVSTVIYTDISKDGALEGTNLDAYTSLAQIKGLNIIASGGVSFEHEIIALKAQGLYGAILGKAIYSGKLDLSKAIRLGE